jgi:hypothetical protein
MITTLNRELVESDLGFVNDVSSSWSSLFARPSRRAASSSNQDRRVFPSGGRLILWDGV